MRLTLQHLSDVVATGVTGARLRRAQLRGDKPHREFLENARRRPSQTTNPKTGKTSIFWPPAPRRPQPENRARPPSPHRKKKPPGKQRLAPRGSKKLSRRAPARHTALKKETAEKKARPGKFTAAIFCSAAPRTQSRGAIFLETQTSARTKQGAAPSGNCYSPLRALKAFHSRNRMAHCVSRPQDFLSSRTLKRGHTPCPHLAIR